jgi:hypothetical protein
VIMSRGYGEVTTVQSSWQRIITHRVRLTALHTSITFAELPEQHAVYSAALSLPGGAASAVVQGAVVFLEDGLVSVTACG